MTIAIDFDGTIVEHAYPEIGKPIPFAIETLKQLIKDGHQLILWTVREGDLLNDAVNYCRERGVEFYAINADMPDNIADNLRSRKLSVDLFIDDRNLGGLPEWGIIYQMIKSEKVFEPFSGEIKREFTPQKKKGFFSKIFK
jgi:hypothetical protein